MNVKQKRDSSNPDNPTRRYKRSRPARGVVYVDGKPTIVFDTVCTKNREHWLATDDVHALLRDVWTKADAWALGRYMVMPDHIHFFAGFTGSLIEYASWVQYWKSQFSKRHKNHNHRWQSDDWDTRMRTWQQYDEKWEYVRWNPVRHELVDHPDAWPFQGTIHDLRWEE